jgi:DNA-binding response OmpR family regulator
MDNREKAAIVLVADDDNAVRQFVRTAIEQIGMEVCEASNGREVMQQFTLRHPDIIVLDVMMPVMDGFAACSKLRGESGGGQIPILMMTGLDDADAIARAYEHGATDFIAKPLNPTMLSQRIRYLLRGPGWVSRSGLRRLATGNGSRTVGNSPLPTNCAG